MQLLLDSAIIEEATKAAEWGWVSGVTTNPTLLGQSSLSPARTLEKLGKIFSGPVFYQLIGSTVRDMKKEARMADAILGKQLVLKIPAVGIGFQAAAQLSRKYLVAVTSIFTPAQAMAANAAGARYALYYHNRAKRLLPKSADLAKKLVAALERTDTRVVAASLKSPDEMVEARLVGVRILSAKFSVLKEMVEHEHSMAALQEFKEKGTGLLEGGGKEK